MQFASSKGDLLKSLRGVRVPWENVIWGVAISAILISFLFVAWKNSSQTSRTDYAGMIVDRSAAYAETDEGSRPNFRLLVESKDGERFTVRVDTDVYEAARIGMRIESKAGKIVLSDPKNKPAGR